MGLLSPQDVAKGVLAELVRDFIQNEQEGRMYDFSTRLDGYSEHFGNAVMVEMERLISERTEEE